MRSRFFRVKATSECFAKLLILSVCVLGCTAFTVTEKPTVADAGPGHVLADLAENLAPDYGQQQMDRLAQKNDRDSLIAAVMIGSANASDADNAKGHAEVIARLFRNYPEDSLAMYTVALICHKQSQACLHPEYQAHLLRLAPDNAIHYLLLPNAGGVNSQVLHAAATTKFADTHFSALLGIVRSALESQPAPPFSTHKKADDIDGDELALILRRNEVSQVPWPNYGALSVICSPALVVQREGSDVRDNCTRLGLMLFSERGNNIVSMMVGSSLVRRFAKGSESASGALALRRQYVWLTEQKDDEDVSAVEERLQDEEVSFGEWQAFKQKAARAGIELIPPADWIPENPGLLVLPEDKTASSPEK